MQCKETKGPGLLSLSIISSMYDTHDLSIHAGAYIMCLYTIVDYILSSPGPKTTRSQRPDHQSGAQLGQFRPTASSASRSRWRSSIHLYISLSMNNNNRSQVEFHFFFSDRAWWSRPVVREGKTTQLVRGHAAGWQGKSSKPRLRRTKTDVFVILLLFSC